MEGSTRHAETMGWESGGLDVGSEVPRGAVPQAGSGSLWPYLRTGWTLVILGAVAMGIGAAYEGTCAADEAVALAVAVIVGMALGIAGERAVQWAAPRMARRWHRWRRWRRRPAGSEVLGAGMGRAERLGNAAKMAAISNGRPAAGTWAACEAMTWAGRSAALCGDRAAVEPTPRELEVVRLVAQGRTDREMAAALHVQRRTVRTHLEHLSEKTGTRGRVALVQWAAQAGWLKEELGVDASG